MLSDAITWLDVLVLLAAYLLASLAWKAVERFQRARGTFEAITTETGGEAAPDPQDDGTADQSRAVCNDPAASPSWFHDSTSYGVHPWEPGCCKENPTPLGSYEIRLDREHVVRRRG